MPSVHREVEVKLAADDTFEIPALTELVAGADPGGLDAAAAVTDGEVVHQTLAATYFDTADLRLAAAGLTLRRRTGGDDAGWHLKVPAGKGARSEVRLPLGRATRTVPQQLQDMVRARSGGAELVPVARIETDRAVRRLVDATGRVLVELADDRVSAQRLLRGEGDAAGTAVPGTTWREIEVELVDGPEEVLAALAAELRQRGLRRAKGPSKLAQVLALDGAAGGAAQDGTGVRLTRRSPAGDVVLAHLREQVEQIRAQDLPVRLDAPDAVHKMRVATRRLRSALRTFKPLLDPAVARPLRDELKWLAAELGAARDAEVMRDRVRGAVSAQAGELGQPAGTTGEEAAAELEAAYRRAHDAVLAELDGERYRALLASLEALVTSPPLTGRAAKPAGKVLPRQVARSYEEVRRYVAEADALAGDHEREAEREELLHDARKAAKAARYAGESVAVVFGTDATDFAAAMEAVQEALGEHQDSVVTRARLLELAAHAPSNELAFTYGRLHALEEVGAREAEQHFAAAWRAAGRKGLHRWLR
ncbi:CYTH and CHAD domain-containing protein [Kineococcus glutinatus]|uniref:CYTH and CHAD domain-containing protein n=1 Tax=Kineococcus glutinatus TaxID=1070872 RepID=A0ABP9HFU6_9ACTN